MFKIIKTLFIASIITTLVFADADTGNAKVHNSFDTATIENTVDDTTKEFATSSDEQSGGAAVIGTAFQLMTIMYGNKIGTIDRGQLSTEALKVEGHTEESMTAFNEELRQQIESDAVTNSAVGLSDEPGQFKCFIARDIPFQYRCSKTLMIYGGGVNETGKKARDDCKSECYQQSLCYNANNGTITEPADVDLTENPPSYDFYDKHMTYEVSYNLNPNRITKAVTTEFSIENRAGEPVPNKSFKADVYVTGEDGVERLLVKRNFMMSFGNMKSWHIERHASKIRMVFYNEDSNGFIARSIYMTAEYKGENRWFCPLTQDISTLNIGSFADSCPSGETITVTSGTKSATICVDGEKAGDNADGTFSSESACSSICRQGFACNAVQAVMSTEQVENFREGCIAGQTNCNDDDCRIARLTDMTVLEEVSFDAEMTPTNTVISGNQVPGVARPRFTKEETLDFEARNIQEWKDGAYQDMIEQGRYNTTVHPIGEDTERSSAFAVGIGTNPDGTSNGLHELLWKVKPSAFETDSDTPYYMYAVLEVDVEYWAFSSDGKERPHRDRIFYIKNAMTDSFKPFVRYEDYGVVDLDERGVPSIIKNEYSSPRSETFSGTTWVSLSPTGMAPYFKTQNFVNPEFYFTEKLVSDMQRINYALPGLRRKVVSNGPVETPSYTGYFDGTGDNVARIAAHVYYSKDKLTYGQVFSSIREDNDTPQEDDQFVKIYDTGFDKKSTRELISDSDEESNPNLDIFRYGKTDKTTVFFRIKPDPSLVGQKGFIYVFIY